MIKMRSAQLLKWLGFGILGATVLAGCGGGASTTSNTNNQQQVLSTYTGPAAADADTRQFQTAFWDNLRAAGRCGGCHDPASATAQAPYFARNDDVNLAYSALMATGGVSLNSTTAVPFIDRTQSSSSYIVTKVRNHNCWLGPAQGSVCADIMTAFIDGWIGSSSGGSTKQIVLNPPALVDAGASKNYPPIDANGVINFTTLPTPATSLHGLLNQHCAGCHVSSSRTAQAPFFAEIDTTKAYEELKGSQKIDLDNPASSRIVVRLREESHNCWTPNNCAANAQELENAVTAFAAGLPTTAVASDLIISKALKLKDAIVASGGDRYENNVIALYEFKRGTGSIAYDTSGVSPAMNLSLSGLPGEVTWVRGYGLQFKGTGKAQASVANSQKLFNMIKDIGEYSLEAWVTPANVTQEGPAHIISYIGTASDRNFTLGQSLYEYDVLNRTNATLGTGAPATMTSGETLQATLQHVVMTVDPVNGKRIYVNGVLKQTDGSSKGTLVNWDNSFAFVMGNNQGRTKPWSGKVRMVAVHNRLLNQAQITQNFKVGVGAKFLMLFSVRNYTCPGNTNANQCSDFIMFEVSEFDNYGYLFSNPVFIRLSNDALASDVLIKGMRIGMNGKEVSAGQAYINMGPARAGVTITTSDDIKAGVPLSTLGTIIASQKGADGDEFFLTFEQLVAVSTHNYTEALPSGQLIDPTAAGLQAKPTVSDIGMRTFDEINATMSTLTGVSQLTTQTEYNKVKQQLPTVETFTGFLSAHQMGVAQMAIIYCDALVEDPVKRTAFFGSFGFGSDVDTAFNTSTTDSAQKNQILNALYNKMIGIPGSGAALTTAPTLLSVKSELIGPSTVNSNNMFDRLYNACASNLKSSGLPRATVCSVGGVQDATRTKAMVKAMCAATLGSAALLVQ